MKYSMDTYRLYKDETKFSYVVRTKVTMKDTVDPDILDQSVNRAIGRYPYFSVRVTVDEDGAYVLRPNRKKVAVLPVGDRTPLLASRRVNGHLVFVEYEGKDIYFCISHSLAGGKGLLPWVMTSVYQYVTDRYHVTLEAPGIRKPDSDLLPGEWEELTAGSLSPDPPIYSYRSKNPAVMFMDYMNGLLNPLKRKPNFRVFTIAQQDLLPFIKNNDASVASFVSVVMARAMDRVLPEKHRVIGAEMAHNPREEYGIPNAHCDLLSHIHIDYEREKLRTWDMEKLGTMTRGQIILQSDPTVSSEELGRLFRFYEEIDRTEGLKQKRAYCKKHDPSTGKGAQHGTFIVNYTGQADWGETAAYIESYAFVVEGHLLLEVSSLGDRIFIAFMQLIEEDKYADAFRDVLTELGIPSSVEGPFPKKLPAHVLPVR